MSEQLHKKVVAHGIYVASSGHGRRLHTAPLRSRPSWLLAGCMAVVGAVFVWKAAEVIWWMVAAR